MIAPGTTLQGRYTIERVIGQGGMGAVYLARQVSLNHRAVAVKQMSMPLSSAKDQERAAAQFQQEAATLAALRHPNLVAVHDFFCEGSEYYLVMEYVEGRTLDAEVERAADFIEIERAVRWGDELCDVLAYLHDQRPPIIFRDLKPSNIIIDEIGHLRLIDFGIARSFQLQSLTSTFVIGAGTPGFASPEQYGTASVDARTDVYALGATLYALLTRQPPCDAIDRVLGRATLTPPERLNPEVPQQLAAVVERMMALQPEQRYATIAAAREALAAAAGATAGTRHRQVAVGTSPSTRTTRAEAQPRPTWTSIALVLLLVASVLGLTMWQQESWKRLELEQRSAQQAEYAAPPLASDPQNSSTPDLQASPSPAPTPQTPVTPAPTSLAGTTPAPTSQATLMAAASPAAASPAPESSSMAPAPAPTSLVTSPTSGPASTPGAGSTPSPGAAPPPPPGQASLPWDGSGARIIATGSGLMFQDLKVGAGAMPRDGQTVLVHYSGWLVNGTRVDSSVDRGQPFKFVLGRGQVIKGWDEGVSTMHVGGRRKLMIPAHLAYGEGGAPPAVPPGAPLILDVELLGVE